jgi:hypothetical protein
MPTDGNAIIPGRLIAFMAFQGQITTKGCLTDRPVKPYEKPVLAAAHARAIALGGSVNTGPNESIIAYVLIWPRGFAER